MITTMILVAVIIGVVFFAIRSYRKNSSKEAEQQTDLNRIQTMQDSLFPRHNVRPYDQSIVGIRPISKAKPFGNTRKDYDDQPRSQDNTLTNILLAEAIM